MRNIKELHPSLQIKLSVFKEECKKQGVKISFGECLRTKAEQDALYAQGRTKPGNIVTNSKGSTYSSQHQWGIAADFYLDMDVDGDGEKTDDAFNNSKSMFNKAGKIAESVGLGWGGSWKNFKDLPHVYLPDWGSTTAKLKNTYGTPENFMKTWGDGKTEKASSKKINEKSKDGYEKTQFIMDIQKHIGAKVDGKAGNETFSKTVTISESKNRTHSVIRYIQKRLNSLGYSCGLPDGIPGRRFTEAVNKYQKEVLGYKKPDGEITAKGEMWKSLLGIS